MSRTRMRLTLILLLFVSSLILEFYKFITNLTHNIPFKSRYISLRNLRIGNFFAVRRKAIGMERKYTLYNQDTTMRTTLEIHEEFQEEDVWEDFDQQNDCSSEMVSFESSRITPRQLPTAARMIPRGNKNSNQESRLVQQSAPVNIPDWSKIYGLSTRKASRNVSFHDNDAIDVDVRGNVGITDSWSNVEDDDGEELDEKMMPPHEMIAKKFARTRVSSFSVCEGLGRTLKGRDLSRVRNTILSRTGFLE